MEDMLKTVQESLALKGNSLTTYKFKMTEELAKAKEKLMNSLMKLNAKEKERQSKNIELEVLQKEMVMSKDQHANTVKEMEKKLEEELSKKSQIIGQLEKEVLETKKVLDQSELNLKSANQQVAEKETEIFKSSE